MVLDLSSWRHGKKSARHERVMCDGVQQFEWHTNDVEEDNISEIVNESGTLYWTK